MFGGGITPSQGLINQMDRTRDISIPSHGSLIAGDSGVRHTQNDDLLSLPGSSFSSVGISSNGSSHAASMYLQHSLEVNNSNLNPTRLHSSFLQQSQHQQPAYSNHSGFGAPIKNVTNPSQPGNGTGYF